MNVRGKVMEGHSLAVALAEYPSVFAPMYRSTVAAGEQSGFLHAVLDNLADHTEQHFESTRDVQMALFYPVMLFVVSVLIIAGLMIYVVPDIVDVFTDTGQELPTLTIVMIATATSYAFTGGFWWARLRPAQLLFRWLLARPEIACAGIDGCSRCHCSARCRVAAMPAATRPRSPS